MYVELVDEYRHDSAKGYGIKEMVTENRRGIDRGSIRGRQGSYYQQGKGGDVVLSANTVAEEADYSEYSSDDPLGKSGDSRGIPRSFARALGAAFHYDHGHSDSQRIEVFRDEFDGNPRRVWERLVNCDPNASPLEELAFDDPMTALTFHADRCLSYSMPVLGEWRFNLDYTPLALEMPFVVEVGGVKFGGQVDEVLAIRDDERLGSGIFVLELKLAKNIRPQNYVQTEAFRRAFWPHLAPIDAMIIRVDPITREREIKSTQDEEWPHDEAWKLFCNTAEEMYSDSELRMLLRQSAWW